MKTLAIRLEEEQHTQLSLLAQLAGNTITDEIRQAIEEHIEAKRANPELTAKAQDALAEMERQAQARQAAIATLFKPLPQPTEETPSTGAKKPNGRKQPANGS